VRTHRIVSTGPARRRFGYSGEIAWRLLDLIVAPNDRADFAASTRPRREFERASVAPVEYVSAGQGMSAASAGWTTFAPRPMRREMRRETVLWIDVVLSNRR
jgi:hypothetical protein